MIAPEAGLSVIRQCALLGVARSSFYYRPRPESAEELALLERVDRIFTDHPVYGSRRLRVALCRTAFQVIKLCRRSREIGVAYKKVNRQFLVAAKVAGGVPQLTNLQYNVFY